jgi:hypothetical protein
MINRPKPGGYGCVDTGSGFFPGAIKLLTRSAYDHAFVVLDDDGTILEAEPNGARIGHLSEYARREMIFSVDTVVGGQVSLADAITFAETLVGVPYGFSDILYLGMELTVGPERATRWLLNQVLDEHTMICSQLVAHFGAHFMADWNCGQKYDQLVTPGMLASRIGGLRVPVRPVPSPA